MEFFKNFQALFPKVCAAEPATNSNEAVASQNVSDSDKPEPQEVNVETSKKEVDIYQKPEHYADIMLENNPNRYDYFPEREFVRYRPSLWNMAFRFAGHEELTRMRCEEKLYKIIKEEPLLKLMIGALNNSGCPVDLRRNFSCEMCYTGVYGGYDTETQQVVICMNMLKKKEIMATIVTHELIHMFDHCVNKTDFKKPEHLACTEIRAINLTSCSLTDAFFKGYVGIVDLIKRDYGKKHAECVKDRALDSVLATSTSLSREEAREIIDRVFPYCYNDLEPIGRRLKNRSTDNVRAFKEALHYGYV